MQVNTEIIKTLMENLENNNMKPYFCENKEEAKALVMSLIYKGATVTNGGSVTMKEIGVMDAVKEREDITYLDRNAKGLTPEEVKEIYKKAFFADVYLMSTNALTLSGELYNVDGNSNRVAALLYGPESVIVVCGVNKIVKNLDEAVKRVKTVAAPKNTVRLHTGSYCENAGECMSLKNQGAFMCDGCKGSGRICCNYVVSAQQRHKDRIKVVIVNEELGY
ncbi:MAG: lactate utilization protein [Clostridia bacterium]|nr:lactate utilization protein [Clostridia bacterium]